MRVTTAFGRLLQIPGTGVAAVSFQRAGVVVRRVGGHGGWSARAAV